VGPMKPGALFSAIWKTAAAAFFLLFALSFLNCAPLFAQGTAGKILGTVTDQSGGAIAGATVIVTDVDRNAPRTLTTGQSGEYTASNLLPGNFKVRAEAKGFKAFERSGVILEVNGEVRVDLVMQPGEVSQTITVNESVPMVETTNAELGATLQSAIIEDIPLNGRNFENLLQLNPGVTIYPGGSGFTQSANGQRPHDNAYMVNGIMASDPWMGQSVFNAVMAAGDAGTIMPWTPSTNSRLKKIRVPSTDGSRAQSSTSASNREPTPCTVPLTLTDVTRHSTRVITSIRPTEQIRRSSR
jgi:hypothetical protein